MYTNKKRQRNFKRIRELPKVSAVALPSNPSKRHRERLNIELESVASLLPYDGSVIARLDKLSVLRLAVSYLRSKTFFQALFQKYCMLQGSFVCLPYSSGISCENEEETLRALGGFLLILSLDGEIIYSTPNVESYLGFHQSDILHQPIYEMVHSEDRDELRRLLFWNYAFADDHSIQNMLICDGHVFGERQASARFRCFLDNTCGFLRIDVQGRMLLLDACLPHCYMSSRVDANFPLVVLLAICIPYVLPSQAETHVEEQFLRSKHSLDLAISSLDAKMLAVLEYKENQLPVSFYCFIHSDDVALVSEAHRQVIEHGVAGMLVYRIISQQSKQNYWFQTSCRLQSKNGKPDIINCSHRILTECEGVVLLEKRMFIAQKTNGEQDHVPTASGWPMNGQPCFQTNQQHHTVSAPTFVTPRPKQQPTVAKQQGKKINKAAAATTGCVKTCKKVAQSYAANPQNSQQQLATYAPNYSATVPCYVSVNQTGCLLAKTNNRGYFDYGSVANTREDGAFVKPYIPQETWPTGTTQSSTGAWNYVSTKSFSIAEVTNTLLGP